MAEDEAIRYDAGKARLDLIPAEWYWALGDVMLQGIQKYPERNWELGLAHGRLFASAMRHLVAFHGGEVYDKQTGCHHLAMAAWNCMALMSTDLRGVGKNDVPPTAPGVLEKLNVNKSDVSTDTGDSPKRTRGNSRGSKLDSSK